MRLNLVLGLLFLVIVPLGTRVLVYQFTTEFSEYTTAFIYLSDIALLLFLFSWLRNTKFLSILRSSAMPLRRTGEITKTLSYFRTHFVFSSIIIFLFFSALSILFADYKILSLYNFVRLLLAALMSLAVASLVSDKKNLRFLMAVLAALAVLESLLGLWQFRNQAAAGFGILGESPISAADSVSSKILIGEAKVLRAYGTFPHPNVLAAFLMLGLFSLYYFWLQNGLSGTGRREPGVRDFKSYLPVIARSAVLAILIFIVLLGLALTFSRTAWAITILLTLLASGYWLVAQKTFRRSAIKLLVVLVANGYWLVASFSPFIAPRAQISANEPAINLRLIYNQLGIDLIKNHPLGVGIGNQVIYATQSGLYQKFGLDQKWQWQPIHNIYLLIASEIGIFGLLIFIAFLASLFINSKSQEPNYKQTQNSSHQNSKQFEVWSLEFGVSLTMLLALLLFGLTDHFLWTLEPGRLMFWLTVGILLGAKSDQKAE